MAIKTYTEQLESVQAAIAVIEGGAQSYTIGNRTFYRGDLGVLYKREERLQPLAARETGGNAGARVRGVIVCD
jgi:hypothetical protein